MRVTAANAKQAAAATGLLTTNDVVRLTGVSYRLVDFYCRRKLIRPVVAAVGSGSARLFSPEVVSELRELRRRIEACPFHPHSQFKDLSEVIH